MSFVKPTTAPPVVGPGSRRPHHGAIAPGRDRPRPKDPADRRAPQHAGRDHTATTLPSAGVARPSRAADDSGHGLVLLSLTVGGALAGTAAVALIALAPTVWVAGFAFAILLALTGALVFAVLHATGS